MAETTEWDSLCFVAITGWRWFSLEIGMQLLLLFCVCVFFFILNQILLRCTIWNHLLRLGLCRCLFLSISFDHFYLVQVIDPVQLLYMHLCGDDINFLFIYFIYLFIFLPFLNLDSCLPSALRSLFFFSRFFAMMLYMSIDVYWPSIRNLCDLSISH